MFLWIYNDFAIFLANDKKRKFIFTFDFVNFAIQFEIFNQLDLAKIFVFNQLICNLFIVEINKNSISIFQMQLKSNNRKFNFVEKEIENSSNDFAKFYSTNVIKDFDFVNEFLVVLSIRMKFIDSTCNNNVEKYIDVIIFSKNIFI